MMEHKFRAWDTQRKIMIPDTGYPQTSFDGDTAPKRCRYIYMQYTGLKDKNKREIYAGDIVVTGNYPNIPAEIIFSMGSFQIDYLSADGDMTTPVWIEIVGNVYQNPGLLNV